MDTCARNGIYDEALDLHAFIMRVALLHPDLPVIKLLAAQVGAISMVHDGCLVHVSAQIISCGTGRLAGGLHAGAQPAASNAARNEALGVLGLQYVQPGAWSG